ncbi:hypothetical protein METUNv1_01370 [Methyloversatilis universalis FAM5]|uniref:Uncharacterized protein n=2 Tax=Methyloversatilis universalis TaxID=378211 RepID=F5RAZ3_METUF|nr:hypothetical protein METUNv1_01370 [Methyloversatilis universalis FAM5]
MPSSISLQRSLDMKTSRRVTGAPWGSSPGLHRQKTSSIRRNGPVAARSVASSHSASTAGSSPNPSCATTSARGNSVRTRSQALPVRTGASRTRCTRCWMCSSAKMPCTERKDHAPQNLSLLKKMVLNLIRTDTSDTAKASLRRKRKRATWDDDIRMAMLGIKPL